MAVKREKGRALRSLPRDFTIIDIETSGLDPKTDCIIEVGCIKFRDGRELNRYSSLLRPTGRISRKIEKLTGITNEMLQGAPRFEIIARALWSYLEGETLVGHNVNFDINFLYDHFFETLQLKLSNDYLDTLSLCRKKYPSLPSYSLENICAELSIASEHHRALSDCMIVAELLGRMSASSKKEAARVEQTEVTAMKLQRGQKIDVTRGNSGLQCLTIDLKWMTSSADVELDAAAFLLDTSGRSTCEDDFIFYNNRKHGSGSVEHAGRASENNERLRITLSNVPNMIERIAFTLTIYDAEARQASFQQVDSVLLRVLDDSDAELMSYELGREFTVETAIVIGELYRYGAEWKFHAIGKGFSGGLAALVRNFGLKTGNKTEQISVSVYLEQKSAIKKLAGLYQCSMSDVVNTALKEFIEKHRAELEEYDRLRRRLER